jgi:DNA repair photolyase
MIGCSNNCAYCYARANAVRNGDVADSTAWSLEQADNRELTRSQQLENGLIMFPTRHDTTPNNLKYNLPYLHGILAAGNHVVFVSKANLSCMQEICRELDEYKSQLIIRVTIGSLHPVFCRFWERKAPLPLERVQALRYAKEACFETSVSMEPMLHGVEDAVRTFRGVEPYVTETIWIGAMNGLDTRVDLTNPNFKQAVADLRGLQSRCELIRLYESLKDEPKVRWKESISRIVGLSSA